MMEIIKEATINWSKNKEQEQHPIIETLIEYIEYRELKMEN